MPQTAADVRLVGPLRTWLVCVGWGAVAGLGTVVAWVTVGTLWHGPASYSWDPAPLLVLWAVIGTVGAAVGAACGAVMGLGAAVGVAVVPRHETAGVPATERRVRAARWGLILLSPVAALALWRWLAAASPADGAVLAGLVALATWFGCWRLGRSLRSRG